MPSGRSGCPLSNGKAERCSKPPSVLRHPVDRCLGFVSSVILLFELSYVTIHAGINRCSRDQHWVRQKLATSIRLPRFPRAFLPDKNNLDTCALDPVALSIQVLKVLSGVIQSFAHDGLWRLNPWVVAEV